MNLLSFDTSSEVLTVAVKTPKASLEREFRGVYQHAEKLIPLAGEILKAAGIGINGCDAFVAGLGPGSFTGLRVGMATLQGLSAATGKPCYGISSLEAMVFAGNGKADLCAAITDARREKFYFGVWDSRSGTWKEKRPLECLTFDAVVSGFQSLSSEPVWLAGDAIPRFEKEISQILRKRVLASQNFWYPHALSLIRLFESRKNQLKPLSDLQMVPQYLQSPEFRIQDASHAHRR